MPDTPIPVEIRQATLSDLDALTELGARTFYETFSAQNDKEIMDRYLSENFNSTQIAKELADTQNQFFMAFSKGEPCGYVKLRRAGKTPDAIHGKKAIELQRIYVVGEYHSKKIGAELMRHCLELAFNDGFEVVWLSVWTENPKAIKFYERWGYTIMDNLIFDFGGDLQTDYLMAKTLK